MAPPLISGRQCVRALQRIGYHLVRQKGSHMRLERSGFNPVTVPDHNELDRGTLRAILRTVGISEDEFRALLD